MKKMVKKICCILMLLLLSLTLAAIDFQGVLFADYYGGVEPTIGYENLRGRLYYQPKLAGSLFDYALDFEISANIYYDFISTPSFIKPENILREAYLSMPFDNFDISIGQKFVSPGMTDVFSPLNAINGEYAFKLSLDDPYEGKRADALIQFTYYPTYDDSIELVYVPVPRPDLDPAASITISDTNVDVNVIFDADPYLLESAHSLFLSYKHYGFDFDLQVSYAFYTEQTPNFDISLLEYSGGVLTGDAAAVYTKNHTFGGAYGTSINGIALVEEVAFNVTEDFSGTEIGIKNSDITFNTQITGTLWGGTLAQLNIIYQYVINFDKGVTPFDSAVQAVAVMTEEFNGFFNQPVEHIVFAIAHFQNSFFHDKLTVSLNAGYLHPDVYLAPRAAFALSDGLQITVGADLKTGDPPDRDLARGNLTDNFYVRLKYEY
ncbi:MAG: hypothetical protein H8D65_00195 [Spirochaetes bacterium]|nr:hypothetical protein [Spirochaetota bacterium]